MIKSGSCFIHKYHYPRPISTELHHIWPLGYHGPDEDWNMVEVGPTCHENIHRVMNAMFKNKPLPKSTRKEKFYAQWGYDQVMAYAASLSTPGPSA